MARNHNINFGTLTIPAAGVRYLDIDLIDLEYLHLNFITDSSPATMTVNIYQGFGFQDPIFQDNTTPYYGQFFIFDDDGSSVPTYAGNDLGPVVLSNNSTSVFLNDILITSPRWIRIKFTNTDGSSHTMQVLGDY